MHALRAAMKTLGRATAHRGLLSAAVAVEPRHDHIRDLLNQCLVIAVIHYGVILTEKVSCKGAKEDAETQRRPNQLRISLRLGVLFAPLRETLLSLILALDRVDLGDAFAMAFLADFTR